MGYKSVQFIYLAATLGKEAAIKGMEVEDGVIDTSVDVITQVNLKEYEAALDAKGVPHEWSTEDWVPEVDEIAQWEGINWK